MKNLILLPLLFLSVTYTSAFQNSEKITIESGSVTEQAGKVKLNDRDKQRAEEIERINNFDRKLEKLILNKKQIRKKLFISVPRSIYKEGIIEYEINYLGSIHNQEIGNIDFLYWEILSGNYRDSLRDSSYIKLYSKNKQVGSTYIGELYPSAPRIFNNNLILKPDSDCDQAQSTTINFENSLPHEFFLTCNQHHDGSVSGDMYKFIYS